MLRAPCGVLLGVFLASGCGSSGSGGELPDAAVAGTDISGWYQVTADLEGPCGAPAANSLPAPAYLWVERRQNIFSIFSCSGSAVADCAGSLFYDFVTPVDGGWSGEGGVAFFSADCTLTWQCATATLSGSVLTVKSLKYSLNQDVGQSECTLTAARALTGPCTYEIELTAERI
jgi:hypothetical protein